MTDRGVKQYGSSSLTSSSLLRGAQCDDQKCWQILVDKYGLKVYGWCRNAGLQQADASDVSQEVFTAVARKLGEFRHDREGDRFRKWLRTITSNKIRDFWRKQRNYRQGVGGSSWQEQLNKALYEVRESSSIHHGHVEAEAMDARQLLVLRVRSETPERDWAILQRLLIDDQAPADIARELGITTNVVYLCKSRILKRMRELAEATEGLDVM